MLVPIYVFRSLVTRVRTADGYDTCHNCGCPMPLASKPATRNDRPSGSHCTSRANAHGSPMVRMSPVPTSMAKTEPGMGRVEIAVARIVLPSGDHDSASGCSTSGAFAEPIACAADPSIDAITVSYTHLRAHET